MSQVTIGDVAACLEVWAPPQLQESYDNAGLITGDPAGEVTGVMVSLDCTEEVVMDAVSRNCNMVVSHHPIVFQGLKKFSGGSYVERALIAAIRNGVALYAIHTNLDAVPDGVNAMICRKLDLEPEGVLRPRQAGQPEGSGMVARLSKPMEEKAFLKQVKERMGVSCLRHTRLLARPVQRVALCGGSGSFLIPDALRAGVDVFITSDIRYHTFFDADGRILLVDIGHYEAEQFTQELIVAYVKEKFPNFAVLLTEIITNPIKYLV
ncbi:MAG: Nif3-like dinuclear metal center hexameric protein [Flavobacteriales bacterium]|nr:Nif3-like dinuclear metal center hexameric protein [Flavobacteriales bacterium]MCB9447190.1 Nif3-like dinuclear metal center hexameric protein [Flavobacteriales bacterium]